MRQSNVTLNTLLVTLLAVFQTAGLCSTPQVQTRIEMLYLDYYLSSQKAKSLEEQKNYQEAIVAYDRARGLLQNIRELDANWRPALINVKLQETSAAIHLMDYYLLLEQAHALMQKGDALKTRIHLENARAALTKAQTINPSWRERLLREEARRCDEMILAVQTGLALSEQKIQESSPPTSETRLSTSRISLPDELTPLPRALTVAAQETEDQRSAREEITKAQQLLSEARQALETVTRERDDLRNRLEETEARHRAEIQQIELRNRALGEELAAVNQRLQASQEEIKKIRQLKLQETIEQLTAQLDEARLALREATKRTEEYEKETAFLKKRLAELEGKLQTQRLAENSELDGGSREAEILREILTKLNDEHQKRLAARDKALEEIKRLEIQSQELLTQIEALAKPLAIPRLPDSDPRSPLELPEDNLDPASPDVADSSDKSQFSPSATALADEADRLYSEGKLEEAAARYEQILEMYPDSVYALANYGVINHQLGKRRTAQNALERAVQISPNDSFSLSMLGIVYCLMGVENPSFYQKAFDVLSRAAKIDPNNALIRNYLGITAFNLNKPEMAERELRRAVELRSDYSVAHINLAVIYANQSPPALEMARRHYIRAIELGHERHPPTEERIRINPSDLPRRPLTSVR